MKYIGLLALIVITFSAGSILGWNTGIHDGMHLEVCNAGQP